MTEGYKEIKTECDCSGCDTCGTHCIEGCESGEGEACTVEDDDE